MSDSYEALRKQLISQQGQGPQQVTMTADSSQAQPNSISGYIWQQEIREQEARGQALIEAFDELIRSQSEQSEQRRERPYRDPGARLSMHECYNCGVELTRENRQIVLMTLPDPAAPIHLWEPQPTPLCTICADNFASRNKRPQADPYGRQTISSGPQSGQSEIGQLAGVRFQNTPRAWDGSYTVIGASNTLSPNQNNVQLQNGSGSTISFPTLESQK